MLLNYPIDFVGEFHLARGNKNNQMKKMKKNKFIYLVLPCLMMLTTVVAAQEDSVVTEEVVKLKYYTENNRMQYLVVENLQKTGKKTQPLKNRTFQLYLDSATSNNLIAKITTDNSGKAKCFIPASLKAMWELMPVHKFIAVPSGKEEESPTELIITKSKIKIDTASAERIRSIKVQVMKYENDDWMPAKDVEMKVGIQRHSSILTAGEEETYTTDSTGTVIVVLKNDSMPGDTKGNMVLIAKVEDNDEFGNLMIEKTVPWGVSVTTDTNFFNQRTLWSTRFKTPLWLLFMAYSIVFVVWGAIIYLVLQIIKIKKLSKNFS